MGFVAGQHLGCGAISLHLATLEPQRGVAQLLHVVQAVGAKQNGAAVVAKLLNTFDYLEVAEFSANSLVMASGIGTLRPIGDKEIEELRVAFNVK